jgi:hypothetical protein
MARGSSAGAGGEAGYPKILCGAPRRADALASRRRAPSRRRAAVGRARAPDSGANRRRGRHRDRRPAAGARKPTQPRPGTSDRTSEAGDHAVAVDHQAPPPAGSSVARSPAAAGRRGRPEGRGHPALNFPRLARRCLGGNAEPFPEPPAASVRRRRRARDVPPRGDDQLLARFLFSSADGQVLRHARFLRSAAASRIAAHGAAGRSIRVPAGSFGARRTPRT